jgi:hypothetical protein
MPAWDDLNQFVDTDDFAVAATLRPVSGAARTVRGIYDAPYMNAQLGEYEVDSSKPRFTCKFVDVVGIKRNDEITIPGAGTFDILTLPQGDGTGMAVLELATR